MRIEDLLPSLREGRRARRLSWKKDHYLEIEDRIGIGKSDRVTKREWATSHSWPDVRETSELLADDWEIMPEPVKDGHVPGNYRKALDTIIAEVRERGCKPSGGWRATVKAVVQQCMESLETEEEQESLYSLIKMAATALEALAALSNERDMREVMRG